MNAWAVFAAAGLAAAVCSCFPSSIPLRLTLTHRGGPESLAGSTSGRGDRLTSTRGRHGAALAAGVAICVTVPGWSGVVAAGLAAGLLDRWLARLPDKASVAAVVEAQRRLPLALELMAAALSAGAPTATAVVLAAKGAGPPLRRPLLEVASSLRLGAGADEAWRGARDDPVLQPLARLAVRSAASGAAMAQACRDLAIRQRQAGAADAEAAIKRAGVLVVLPLALCFLPAFVLVGVVPVVLGLIGSLAL